MFLTRLRNALTCGALALALCIPGIAAAQGQGTLAGAVTDPLGARVPGAAVTLLGEQGLTGKHTADAEGAYEFAGLAPGRYRVTAKATGFSPATSEPVYVSAGSRVSINVTVQIGPLQQAVVVTAAAADLPQAQTGAPVTVVDRTAIEALNKPDLFEALRLVPGSQIEQTGGRGGTTSMFIRGGTSSFAKVLIDGIVANDIGGSFDFSQMQTTGVEQIEVLRQSNSVIYGSDALTGVINISTRRGRARVPEVTYAVDGGNFGTFNNATSFGGAYKRIDYFSEYSYFTSDNDVPNNRYRNHTYAARVGLALGGGTDLSGTFRRIDGKRGAPNGFSLYGIADDASSGSERTYAGVAAQSQWTGRWQSTVRFGSTGQTSSFVNPTPTGEAFDPFGFGANYLGNEVTITGANGYSATGRAILDFGGAYPSTFDSRTTRRALSGRATYLVGSDIHISGGGRFEREQGFSDPDGEPSATRDNGGLFVEARGSIGGRTYLGAGLGYERNAAFGSATTPRLWVTTYLRQPVPGRLGDTKVTFNVGNGVKAPSVFQVQGSLDELALGSASGLTTGPIGPERSRSLDVGVEQGFADGQARVRVSYFHNRFEDLIEFVSKNVLPQVGVPPEVAQAAPFGAYVNSSSFTAQGVETSVEALVATRLRLMVSYTYLDAEVSDSFASSALQPAINPSIPGVRIGAFSSLVGQRPFRRPTHSGALMASYAQGAGQVTLSAYFSGKRDGSTFLSDAFFGNSMLLPNKDLETAYQKVDLGGAYQVRSRLKLYVNSENLLDRKYESSFGFPALPRTVRGGVAVSFGGDN